MDYFDRLILRALAQPRNAAPGLFDPFERVAPWALEEEPPRGETVRHTPSDAPDVVLARPPLVPAAVATYEPPPSFDSVGPRGPLPAVAQAEPPAVTSAAHVSEPAGPAVRGSMPSLPPANAPLSRADAFMRSLGVPVTPPEGPHRLPLRSNSPERRDEAHPVASPAETPQAARSQPATLRPLPPLTQPMPTPLREAAHTASPRVLPGANAERAQVTRTSAQDAAETRRIVHTVVVAPPSQRMDDLAHSSGISRFGIGQS